MVFLLTLYCFFLYNDEIIAAMLVVEPVYFLASSITLHIIRKGLQITLEPPLPIAEKNQEIPVQVLIKNHARVLIASFRIRLRIENSFTGEKEIYQFTGKVKGNAQQTLSITFRAQNCGTIRITLERCRIYDFLYIFKDTWKLHDTQSVGILPACRLLPVEITRKTREFIADAEEFSDRERGDDPSEIYQVREYRERDSLHDIHWKLSAKADELLVKEHGKPLGCVVLIWLNLEMTGKQKGKAGRKAKPLTEDAALTNLLEIAASLSLSLLEEKCVHMVAWYEPENQTVYKKRVSKEEHIYELLSRLLFVRPHQDGQTAQSQYEETFRGTIFSTIVEFRLNGTVWINDEMQMSIPLRTNQINWDELYFTV